MEAFDQSAVVMNTIAISKYEYSLEVQRHPESRCPIAFRRREAISSQSNKPEIEDER